MADDLRAGILTKEEYLQGVELTYRPAILTIKKQRQHTLTLDKVTFKQFDVEKSSIVAEPLTKEATEKAHIKALGRDRTFNIFAKGAKYIQSLRNGVSALPRLHSDVLREYSMIFDRDGLQGDGGNNGLLQSNDPNYVTNPNVEIPAATGSGFNRTNAMKSLMTSLKLQVNATTADDSLIIYYWGDELIMFLGEITEGTNADNFSLVEQSFKGKTVTWVEIPDAVLPEDYGNGFVVVSANMAVLDYTLIPSIEDDGVNEENKYYYANYATGSLQVTPETYGAIIKQPVTFAA